MYRTIVLVAVVLMAAGCGSRQNEILDGSPDPDTHKIDTKLGADDFANPKPDLQTPDLQTPDLQTPDTYVPKDKGTCGPPSYSSDCSQVPKFQCGVSVSCVNGTTLKVSWHEHVFCPGADMEQIHSYNCTYTCPKGCKTGYTGWPSNGTQLVKDGCNP